MPIQTSKKMFNNAQSGPMSKKSTLSTSQSVPILHSQIEPASLLPRIASAEANDQNNLETTLVMMETVAATASSPRPEKDEVCTLTVLRSKNKSDPKFLESLVPSPVHPFRPVQQRLGSAPLLAKSPRALPEIGSQITTIMEQLSSEVTPEILEDMYEGMHGLLHMHNSHEVYATTCDIPSL
jgi:hypothetical protein